MRVNPSTQNVGQIGNGRYTGLYADHGQSRTKSLKRGDERNGLAVNSHELRWAQCPNAKEIQCLGR